MNNKIIKIDDIQGRIYMLDNWKPSHSENAKDYFLEEFNELKSKYQQLLNELALNKMIYNSKITFKPIVGKKYFLYKNNKNKTFMSLISPEEWKCDPNIIFLGTYKQDIHLKWTSV